MTIEQAILEKMRLLPTEEQQYTDQGDTLIKFLSSCSSRLRGWK